jgi:glycosyltransferase involved in cell wall biosynthesis
LNSNLSVLVTPRELHYQRFLYQEIEKSGVRVRYTVGPTPSQTINLLLAPAVLAWYRARGFRILHIHWVFLFSLPWARKRRWARRLMEWWFGIYLRAARLLDLAIVWTAHDLLPHEQVFADDRRARDLLISRASLIIALSETTANELRALGAGRVRVVPLGSYAAPHPVTLTRDRARASFGFVEGDVVVALIGRIEEYKGADLLLRAVHRLPTTSRIKVLIAGLCVDAHYRDLLIRLARESPGRVVTEFKWIPDDEMARYYQAVDLAAFPFREITNSGSIMLAQSFGKPVVMPALANLADIPVEAAIRYDPRLELLVNALERAEHLSEDEYRQMSSAGLEWANRFDWSMAAQETIKSYEEVSPRR